MKHGIIFLFILLIAGLWGITRLNADVEIALEAELANTRQDPMVVAEDELASNGKYVWMEGAPATGGGGPRMGRIHYRHPRSGHLCVMGARLCMGWQQRLILGDLATC